MVSIINRAKRHLFINTVLLTIGALFCIDIGVLIHMSYTKTAEARNGAQDATIQALLNGLPKAQPWKLSIHPDMGVSVKYPYDWKSVTREDYQIHFVPKESDFNPETEGQGSIVIFFYPEENEELIPESYGKRVELEVAHLPAVRYESIPGSIGGDSYKITDTLIKHPKGIIGITYFNNLNNSQDDADYVVYQAIIDSFRQEP